MLGKMTVGLSNVKKVQTGWQDRGQDRGDCSWAADRLSFARAQASASTFLSLFDLGRMVEAECQNPDSSGPEGGAQ